MAYHTITTLMHSDGKDTDCLEAAIDLARQVNAHLTVVLVGINAYEPGLYYAGMNTAMISTGLDDADAAVKAMSDALQSRLAAEDIQWDEVAVITPAPSVGQALVNRARYCDLTVLPQPYGDNRGVADVAALESALLDSSAPILVMPNGKNSVELPKRILLPWDEGAPAMAAAKAGLPFLAQAEEVVICIIDPPSHGPERSDPGGQLAAYLSRHGVKVRISVLPGAGQRVSDVILAETKSQGTDMIVMGGYGHSRTRQYISGGTTRRMLESSPVPLLMAH